MGKDLSRIVAQSRTGEERLVGTGQVNVTVLDFWRWSASDLLSNAQRGVFAEFIIALAAGCDIRQPREPWGSFDLTTPEGIKLEVKSAAYLQSWNQPGGLSRISFSTKAAFHWDPETNKRGPSKQRFADVYAFCLLHHTDKANVDPLNLEQWTFYVLSRHELDGYERSRHSITLKSLQAIAKGLRFEEVRHEVERANARNDSY